MSAPVTSLNAADGAKKAAKASAWKNLLGLVPYLRKYTGGIALGLVTLALMGLVGIIWPLATGVITDTLAGSPRPFEHPGVSGAVAAVGAVNWLSKSIPFYAPHSRYTLGIYCLVLIFCVALKGVLSFSTRWILIGVSRDIEYDLRNDLLAKLVQMEPEFYVRNRTGELMSRCTNDLNSVRMVLGPGIMYSANTIATMVLAVILMFWISATLSFYVLLPVPIVAVTVWVFGRQIHALYGKIQALLAVLSAKAQENLAGVRVVRAYGQEEAEIRGFDQPN